MTTDRILTTVDAIHIGVVVDVAARGATVARLIDETVFVGTARSIGTCEGTNAGRGVDVRDQFLRVTLDGGSDTYWPVADLMPEVESGFFIVDYRR